MTTNSLLKALSTPQRAPWPDARPPRPLPRADRARREARDSDQFATRLHADRTLRVAASFCETQDEAWWLCRRLHAVPQLGEHQVHVLRPVQATPRRFARCRGLWDGLRSRSSREAGLGWLALLPAGGLAGALLGWALGLLTDLTLVDTLGLVALCLLLGLAAGLGLQALIGRSSPPRRFDQEMQRRLARGQYAVLVTDVRDPATARLTIDVMRSVGVYWCAESPRRGG